MKNITVIKKYIELKYNKNVFKNYSNEVLFIFLEENNNTYNICEKIGHIEEPLSILIAESLNNWDSDLYKISYDYDMDCGECEECGTYYNKTWTIVFDKNKDRTIEIFEDDHLNGSYGFLDKKNY